MRSYFSPATMFLLALSACSSSSEDDDDDSSSSTAVVSTAATDDDGGSSTTTTAAADESSTAAADESTGDDPFAGCERGVLETDLMGQDAMGNPVPVAWSGPGVDQATGELIDDGSTYVVSTTYLELQTSAESQALFGEVMGPVIPELYGNPGLVATQIGISASCMSARTFSVWVDEAAMMAFVTGDAHSNAISHFAELSRSSQSGVTHWTDAPVAEITWDAALEHFVP